MTSPEMDNELDLRGLLRTLWRGKRWIVGCALVLVLVAYLWSLLVKQEWSATAITARPTVNMLGGYYSQQQFLYNLDARNNAVTTASPPPTVMDEAYQEFVMQLSAWDTRRDFWLQTDYYKQHKSSNARRDAALLDEMINNIQFTPADAGKNINDSVRLVAETAADANNLLRQYVAFASERTARHLNEELTGDWSARTAQLSAQVARQEAVAKAVYGREVHRVQQALKIAQQQGIDRINTDTPSIQLPDSELFLLGRQILQARLENLQASGPGYDLNYDQNRVMLGTLETGPMLNTRFQTYRYLRTPEEPVKRDSPRRLFLMIMWGAVGVFIGAGIALTRQPRV